MPVPFEAVLHMGMVVVMFGVAGTGYNVVRRLAEDGKVRRKIAPFTSLFFSCRLCSLARADPLLLLFALSLRFPFDTLQPIRHSLDDWERMMMKRDERLTGSLRGQSVRPPPNPSPADFPTEPILTNIPTFSTCIVQTNPIAPKEFATNSAWSTEKLS